MDDLFLPLRHQPHRGVQLQQHAHLQQAQLLGSHHQARRHSPAWRGGDGGGSEHRLQIFQDRHHLPHHVLRRHPHMGAVCRSHHKRCTEVGVLAWHTIPTFRDSQRHHRARRGANPQRHADRKRHRGENVHVYLLCDMPHAVSHHGGEPVHCHPHRNGGHRNDALWTCLPKKGGQTHRIPCCPRCSAHLLDSAVRRGRGNRRQRQEQPHRAGGQKREEQEGG